MSTVRFIIQYKQRKRPQNCKYMEQCCFVNDDVNSHCKYYYFSVWNARRPRERQSLNNIYIFHYFYTLVLYFIHLPANFLNKTNLYYKVKVPIIDSAKNISDTFNGPIIKICNVYKIPSFLFKIYISFKNFARSWASN